MLVVDPVTFKLRPVSWYYLDSNGLLASSNERQLIVNIDHSPRITRRRFLGGILELLTSVPLGGVEDTSKGYPEASRYVFVALPRLSQTIHLCYRRFCACISTQVCPHGMLSPSQPCLWQGTPTRV